ncbi:MAG: GGDEF domain-containing protein [Ruminococcus sp.]|nr:GGDEF domain-containing protein [Ruminococcus sp.]
MNGAGTDTSGICRIGRVTVDSSFHTQTADESFFSFFGNDAIYSIRRTIEDEDFSRLEECMRSVVPGEVRRTAIRMRGISGELRWVLAELKISRSGAESLTDSHDSIYSIDLSDIISLEELAFSRERTLTEYRSILGLISDLAFEYSFETKKIRIYMFDSCREIVLADELLDTWQDGAVGAGYVPPRYEETFSRLCSDIRGGAYRFDHEIETSVLTAGRTKELCLFRGITRYSSPADRKVTGIISVSSSRQKAKDVNLLLEANRDSLSGLLSKNAVTSIAASILESRPSYNVNLVILDIDNFTDINSRYGHLFGDEVIYTIADIVRSETGERGYAGRISGGGFLIVLEGTRDETDLRGILRAIRTNTEFAFAGRFEDLHLTCSMGVSTYPTDSSDYDELFMQADKALYIAQQKGKNRYVIYDINKHGPVEKDIENKIAFLSSDKDTTKKLAFASDLAELLIVGKLPDISVLLEQIRTQFGIDDICVFAGSDMSLILSCGNASSRDAAYFLQNRYSERFSGDGIFVIDNVNELEGRDDAAFAQLRDENIGGAVQYLMTEGSMVKGMISFCYIGRFKKWADSDTNYLAVIGRVITALLRKQAFI